MKLRFLVTTFAVPALLMAACGSDDDTGEPSATNESAAATPTTAAPATDAADQDLGYGEPYDASNDRSTDAAATVMVATHDDLGEHLVDGDGRTLYLFTADDGTTTACTGGCVDIWPPLIAAEPVGGDGIDAAELGTADGIEPEQVTYHGHLLYYYFGDGAPGDANGVGIPQWYAVDPNGEPIE